MNKLELKQVIDLAKQLRMQDREDELTYKITDKLMELEEQEQAALGMRFIAGENYKTLLGS